jgi:hypothetical protein
MLFLVTQLTTFTEMLVKFPGENDGRQGKQITLIGGYCDTNGEIHH